MSLGQTGAKYVYSDLEYIFNSTITIQLHKQNLLSFHNTNTILREFLEIITSKINFEIRTQDFRTISTMSWRKNCGVHILRFLLFDTINLTF